MDSLTKDLRPPDGHIAFLYDSPEERLETLANYFKEGVENHELCILVTPESEKEIIEAFKSYGFDAKQAIKDRSLRLFRMNETYVPNGHFMANYMLHNVEEYIKDAKSHGYKGLRTAGEMSWILKNPDAMHEAIEYERLVNTLTQEDSKFTGMCLYPVQETFSELRKGVLTTHPSLLFDNDIHHNLQFEFSV